MSPDHAWIDSALAVFREACELPPDQHTAFLDGACGRDAVLRGHVEAMLARDRESTATDAVTPLPVRAALCELARGVESAEDAPLPQRIGGYRIVRLVAQGGMGVVYEAEQEHPRRRVALKVAHVGGTTGERAQRFELEAQLLARLDHPGIARIIEAGTTGPEAGARPFFAMEFVEGRPLTGHAQAHLRTARAKLELMVSVCEAVGFAHRQGVIHRDLKPDNVFVDTRGRPKVLDFGVAKVEAAGGFGAATLRTEAGRVLGTLGYMAPEQLDGQTEGLGPQADVYSLGVMIYELLTGRLPHDLTAATPTQALAIVTTTDAPLLGVVRPEFRGDIEAVVAKALEKDPRHRYADAVALQSDLERYLRGEPTLARPAGPLLKLAKWTRRRPAQATAVFAVFLTLVAVAGVLLVKNREVQAALDEFELLADSKLLERAATEADAPLGEGSADEAKRRALLTLPVPEDIGRTGRDDEGPPRALRTLPARQDKVEAIDSWLEEHGPLADPAKQTVYERTLAGIRRLADHHADGSWVFADPLLQLKHDVLARMVTDLEAFQRPETGLFAQMQARLALATTIAERTVAGFEQAWHDAIDRIRTSEKYHGLVLEPQVGLIPLGPDPESRLEEFLHFETHAGQIPVRDAYGLPVTDDTGIVLVLIPVVPGQKVLLGAQNQLEAADYYDPQAVLHLDGAEWTGFEKLHEVPCVGPFFLSKYEMTQGQWRRAMGANPSAPPVLLSKPVNMVSWYDCDETTRRLGLRLPTEWEWEYAARAGTKSKTAFWTGQDPQSLAGKENLFDQTAADHYPGWSARWKLTPAPWRDPQKQARFADKRDGPAPVGSYSRREGYAAEGANGFGLYDVAGNVFEWCSSGPFEKEKRQPSPEHRGRIMVSRIIRGGSMKRGVDVARSAARRDYLPIFMADELGLRPAMTIQ